MIFHGFSHWKAAQPAQMAAHCIDFTDPDRYGTRRWSTWRAVKRFPAAGAWDVGWDGLSQESSVVSKGGWASYTLWLWCLQFAMVKLT